MKGLLEDPLMPLHYCDGGDPGQSLAGVVGRGKYFIFMLFSWERCWGFRGLVNENSESLIILCLGRVQQ